MHFRSSALVFVQLLASASFTLAQYVPPSGYGGDYGNKCVTGVHMIVARGSIEPPGPGIIGDVAYEVMNQVPNSDMVPVPYPATLSKYKFSEEDGIGNMTKLLKEYTEKCPDNKIALLGYSQGAQIIGNMLFGNSESHWNQTKPLDLKWAKNIVAIIQWGDPTFIPGLVWDRGTAKQHGIFPRLNLKPAQPYADIVQSFCNKNDIACASGNSVAVHTSYDSVYTTQSANFIAERYNNPVPLKPRPLQKKPKCRGKNRPNGSGSHPNHHNHDSGSNNGDPNHNDPGNNSGNGSHKHKDHKHKDHKPKKKNKPNHNPGHVSGPGSLSPSNPGKNHNKGNCNKPHSGQSPNSDNAAGRNAGSISKTVGILTVLAMILAL